MKTLKTIAMLFSALFIQTTNAQCWTQIAAGQYHTVALKSDGTLWAWGNNDNGQLGDGTTVNKSIPTQIGTDTDWATIEAFYWNTFAIKTDGSLWGWGSNSGGQLGDGNFGSNLFYSTPSRIGLENNWIKITTGSIASFGLKTNGTIWGWGYNIDGRLGTGDFINHYTPVQIGNDTDWTDLNAGGNQVLALKSNHTLWGWGLNKSGSLAIGPPSETNFITTPTQTGNNTADWQKIEVGGCCSSKMIKTDGSLWAMGLGTYGNLGTGGTSNVNTPTQVGIDSDWNTVANSNNSAAIKSNGSLWAWGINAQGQIGDGTFTMRFSPVTVGADKTWLSVKTGENHTVAITADHTLYAWGFNNKGQLGDGTLETRANITQIGNSCPLGTASFEALQAITAYPNPTAHDAMIRFLSGETALVTITTTNMLGQTMSQKTVQGKPGENRESIDLSMLSAGVYGVSLSAGKQQVTIKIIKN